MPWRTRAEVAASPNRASMNLSGAGSDRWVLRWGEFPIAGRAVGESLARAARCLLGVVFGRRGRSRWGGWRGAPGWGAWWSDPGRPGVCAGCASRRRWRAVPGRDGRSHRGCPRRWRDEVSLGFGGDGKRLRRKVSGHTRQDVKDKLKALHADPAGARKVSADRIEGGPAVSVLLRDVIDIGEQAGAEDYVLRLTDRVTGDAVARTLAD
jgi:hypothetical protein